MKRNTSNLKRILAAFSESGLLAYQNYESNADTFPERLSLWMELEGCDEISVFLKKTGLEKYVQENDFHALLTDQARADLNLSTLLSLHLPGYILRKTEVSMPPYFGHIAFNKSAQRWREQQTKIPIITLPNDVFEAFQLDMLERFSNEDAHTSAMRESVAPSHTTDQPCNEIIKSKILLALQNQTKRSQQISSEELCEKLLSSYRHAPQSMIQLFFDFFESEEIPFSKEEIKKFFLSLDPYANGTAASKSLEFLRRCNNKTVSQLSVDSGYSDSLIMDMEKNRYNINTQRACRLIKALNCSHQLTESFIRIVDPDITKNVGNLWLRNKVRTGNFEHITYPALDEDWLNAQSDLSDAQKAGLMLCAFRYRKNLLQTEVASKLGYSSEKQIIFWENGQSAIPLKKIEPLCNALSLSDEEVKELILQAHPNLIDSVGIHWLEEKIKSKNWLHIAYPAFDKTWRSAQDKKKQASLLVQAHLDCKGISGTNFARLINCPKNLFFDYISRYKPIAQEYIEKICAALELSENETRALKEAISLSNSTQENATTLRAPFRSKKKTSLGATHRTKYASDLCPPEEERDRSK